MLLYFLIAIVSIVCGVLLGQNKGLWPWTGFLLTFFLGPLGLLIVACLPNKKREEAEEEQRLMMEQQLHLQRLQIEQLAKGLTSQAQPSRYPNPPQSLKIKLTRSGQHLGDTKFAVIQTMLGGGQLTLEDCYFDEQSNDWLPLECHPAFVT